ncbi:hypothetical protein F5Y13DRAFT_200957 [Hypoxylon sp. FL1857]|nr:hypothetical protein F5Y13DRAFT_200957 [Hypoxylon sp. FL1857]
MSRRRRPRRSAPPNNTLPSTGSPIAGPPVTGQPMVEPPMIEQPSSMPFTHMALSNREQNETTPPHYNIDDTSMIGTLQSHPITSGAAPVSCYFRSVSLRPLEIRFRDLSDYGDVIEESAEKLVIWLRHRDPATLMIVVWRAWVTKYLEDGTLCTMSFEPLIPYRPVKVTIQNVDPAKATTQTNTMREIQQASTSSTNTSRDTTNLRYSAESASVNTTYTAHMAPPYPAWQWTPQHPLVEYDYSYELTVQFAQLRSLFPAAFPVGTVGNQSNTTPSPHQGVPTYQGAQGLQGVQYPNHPGAQIYQDHYRGGYQGYRGQRGSRDTGAQWSRGGRGRGRDQLHDTSSDTAPLGGRERGIKRPREDATDEQPRDKRQK